MARERVSQAEEWQAWAQRYDVEGGLRTFESGLTLKVFLGAIFIGLLMMPGSIYLTLVAGQSGAGRSALGRGHSIYRIGAPLFHNREATRTSTFCWV